MAKVPAMVAQQTAAATQANLLPYAASFERFVIHINRSLL